MRRLIAVGLAVVLLRIGNAIAGTWTTLDYPGGFHTDVRGISGNNIVGYYSKGTDRYTFLYDGTTWTTLNLPSSMEITGISGNTIFGWYGGNAHGFTYDGTTLTTLVYPGALETTIWSINGNMIFGYCDYGTFQYDGTNWTNLNYLGPITGVSGNNIVGFYGDASAIHGFLDNGTGWTNFDCPGAKETVIWGISGNNIVGNNWDNGGNQHAFLYDGKTWTTLTRPDYWDDMIQIAGISGNNIVGNDNGGGFLYTIPEPLSITLFSLSFILLRTRKK